MAFISADRVKETTETAGTGAITLAGASAGYRSFASVMSAADTCHYCIVGNNEWEVGLGTYDTTLARTTVIASSNAGSAVNFSAGTKDVFITLNQQTILSLAAAVSHAHGISDVTGLQAALDAKLDDSQLDTDTTLAANSDSLIATQKAVKAYADTKLSALTMASAITQSGTPVANSVGFLGAPQIADQDDYTLALTDSGGHYYHVSGTPHTLTIPANGSVAFPIGTVIVIVNENGAGNITLAITSDTLRWGSSTGSRTIAANGTATLLKVTSTVWRLTGDGIT